MDGLVKIPIPAGLKELCWYVGSALVNGTGQLSPECNLRVDKDADFVACRGFLVEWPGFTTAGMMVKDSTLKVQGPTAVTLRDGATKRALSVVGGLARAILPDADQTQNRMIGAIKGFSTPLYMKAGSNFFAELNNPNAGGTNWWSDLYLVLEGYNLYAGAKPQFGKTIEGRYAVPYRLNGSQLISDPSVLASSIAGQFIRITNNGEGEMLVRGVAIEIVDNSGTGVDVTEALMVAMGFQIQDSTSGGRQWVRNPLASTGNPIFLPGALLTYGQGFLPFNRPRFLDKNANVQIQVIFSNIANALTYLHGAATWPVQVSFSFVGDLFPR